MGSRVKDETVLDMRAYVLGGVTYANWEAGLRSATELKEAATLFDRSAAIRSAPAVKARLCGLADRCRRQADAL